MATFVAKRRPLSDHFGQNGRFYNLGHIFKTMLTAQLAALHYGPPNVGSKGPPKPSTEVSRMSP